MISFIIGIDISAKTLDVCLKKDDQQEFLQINNCEKEIKKLFKSLSKNGEELIIGMENTGRYNFHLYEVLKNQKATVFVIHPFHLKKSLGLIRGKNDKIDSERIAIYVEKNRQSLIQWKPCGETITKMKFIATERKSKVKTRTKLLQQSRDLALIKDLKLKRKLRSISLKNLNFIKKQIKELDQLMEQTINQDQEVKEQIDRVRSVPGVGKVLSCAIMVKTEGFTCYNDPRKLACCAGVVPFNYQSGTSVHSRNKISHLADKSLKTLLHLSAMRAVRLECDLKHYYLRKVQEGKNKMSVLNAVRNKLIHIIFSLIKNQTNYKNQLQLS